MKYEIEFFKGLSQIEGLEKLLKISIIKNALISSVLKGVDPSTFKLENHMDHCLTLANEKYLLFIILESNDFIITEIKQAISLIDHYIPVVVKLEKDFEAFGFKKEIDLSIQKICDTAIRKGVPNKNLFLIFLRVLFDNKPY
jgi:hypothetical protein